MSAPQPNDLIAYLYDEADDPTRNAVDQKLENCHQTREQLKEWQATMDMLDKWIIDERPAPKQAFWTRATPFLQAAAAIALLLGLGTMIGKHWSSGSSESNVASVPDAEATVTALVAEGMQKEREAWVASQEEVEKKLILASGSMTHRQVQKYLGQALEHLDTHAVRNETLAMFLPPQEQQAYQNKREALEKVAEGVAKEGQRREEFTQQIIQRAQTRASALRSH
jgi:hypothetical protein